MLTTALIVYLFPKSGKFKYNFEKGKPWQSETLQAPFTFAIKKTDAEITTEQNRIKDNAVYYFDRDTVIKSRVIGKYNDLFEEFIKSDSLSNSISKKIKLAGYNVLDELYKYGVLTGLIKLGQSLIQGIF